MNIIKLILTLIGLFCGVILVFWVLGFLSSLLWYVIWAGLLGGIAYGAYKLFLRAEAKVLGGDSRGEIGSGIDVNMSWDEYDKKYLHK